jgi:hypothetical protein
MNYCMLRGANSIGGNLFDIISTFYNRSLEDDEYISIGVKIFADFREFKIRESKRCPYCVYDIKKCQERCWIKPELIRLIVNIDNPDSDLEKLMRCLQKNELFPRNNKEIISFLVKRMNICDLIEGNQSLFEHVLGNVGPIIDVSIESINFWEIMETYDQMLMLEIRNNVDEYPFGNLVEFLTAVATLCDLSDLSARIIEAVDHLAEDTKILFLAPFLKYGRYYLPCSNPEIAETFLEKIGFRKGGILDIVTP